MGHQRYVSPAVSSQANNSSAVGAVMATMKKSCNTAEGCALVAFSMSGSATAGKRFRTAMRMFSRAFQHPHLEDFPGDLRHLHVRSLRYAVPGRGATSAAKDGEE